MPSLDRLFPHGRRFYRVMKFIPDQPIESMPSAEALDEFLLMLPDPLNQVRGHSHIEGSMLMVGKDIYAGLSVHNG